MIIGPWRIPFSRHDSPFSEVDVDPHTAAVTENTDDIDEILSDWMEHEFRLVVYTERMRTRLRQEKIWVDGTGKEIPLEKIDARYASNIIAFLARRAPVLWAGACAEFFVNGCPFQGEQATYSWEEEQDRTHAMTPDEWLEDQPLIQALRERLLDPAPAPPSRLPRQPNGSRRWRRSI